MASVGRLDQVEEEQNNGPTQENQGETEQQCVPEIDLEIELHAHTDLRQKTHQREDDEEHDDQYSVEFGFHQADLEEKAEKRRVKKEDRWRSSGPPR